MMLQTVYVYSLIFFTLFLCGIISYKRANVRNAQISFFRFEIWLPIFVFTIIFGLRYDVGQDHLYYLDDYNSGDVYIYEFFFKFIATNFRDLGLHSFWFFSLWVFIQIFFFYYALREEQYLLPFVIIPLIMGQYYFQWLNTIRQDTAACIFFFMAHYIYDKKCFKYYLWCFILLGFHKSALILFLLYPLLSSGRDLTINKYVQLVLFVFSFIFVITKVDIIATFFPYFSDYMIFFGYDNYSENILNGLGDKTTAGNGLSVRLLFWVNLIVIFYSDKLKSFYNSRKFTIIYNIGFWGGFFQQLCTNNLALARPFRYFKLFTMMNIAYLLYYLYKNGKIPQNSLSLFIILSLMFLMFIATIINEPFNFIWDK